MIQRKQSIFLFLVAVLAVLVQVLPIATFQDLKLGITSIENIKTSFVLDTFLFGRIFSFLILVLSLVTIFLFKKRKLQIKLCNLLLVFEIGLIISIVLTIKDFIDLTPKGNFPSLGIASYFPVISLILTLMAQTAIKKDEELVRSADRLR